MSDETFYRRDVTVGTTAINTDKITVTLYEPTDTDENTIIVGLWRNDEYNNIGIDRDAAKALIFLLQEAVEIDEATFRRRPQVVATGPRHDYEASTSDEDFDLEPVGSYDLSDDGDALASAGWGTDEDYE
jgi:hypothetical protein